MRETLSDDYSKIKELDDEIGRVQRSTKTLFSFASPLHNALRMRSKVYYRWHTFRFAPLVHWFVLINVLTLFSLIFYSTLTINGRRVMAYDKTWDGGGTEITCPGHVNDWSCNANWSGDLAPGMGQTVLFDGTSSKNSVLDASATNNLISITIASGYTGTLSLGQSIHLDIGFSQADGTFTSGTYGLDLGGDFVQSGGIFNAPGGAASLSLPYGASTLNITGGTFNHNNGRVVATSFNNPSNFRTHGAAFYNLTLGYSGGGSDSTAVLVDSFSVENLLTINNTSANTFNVNGSGSPTITVKDITVTQTLGTINYGTGIATNVARNVTTSNMTDIFGTVNLTDSAQISTINAYGITNLTCSTPGKTIKFTAGSTTYIYGNIQIAGDATQKVTIRSTSDGTTFNTSVGGATRTYNYVDVKDQDNSILSAITATNSIGADQNNTNITFTNSPPTVTTQAATSLGETAATANGNITATGGVNATTRGFKYGLTETDTWTWSEGGGAGDYGTGAYTGSLTGLTAGQTYHIRAFATNTEGTSYGAYVSFTTSNPTVTLDLAGSPLAESGGTATATATLSNASAQAVTVNLSFSGTATLTDDYTRSGTSIVIAAGDTTGAITLTGVNDTIDEENETVIVDISSVTNGTESGAQQTTAIITDDDAAPTVAFSAATSSGAESTTPATFTVNLSTASGKTVTVDYAAANSTATAGSDYTAATGMLTFVAGETSKTIDVAVTNDTTNEASETFTVTLSNPSNASLGTSVHTYTILDNDTTPTVTLSASAATIAENGGVSTITAALSVASGQDVTIGLNFTGTAVSGTNYNRSADSIIIPAGSTSGGVVATGVQDHVVNSDDGTVIVSLGSITNATAGSPDSATITITNIDTTVTYTITASAGAHGTISPTGARIVDDGASQSFTVTPADGYKIDTLIVDGSAVPVASSYLFASVIADHTISATFAIKSYTITASVNNSSYGSISPAGATTLEYNASQAYTITAASGYHILDVVIDGVSSGVVAAHTFANVTADHTIGATFTADPAPNTSVPAPTPDAPQTLTITSPATGFIYMLITDQTVTWRQDSGTLKDRTDHFKLSYSTDNTTWNTLQENIAKDQTSASFNLEDKLCPNPGLKVIYLRVEAISSENTVLESSTIDGQAKTPDAFVQWQVDGLSAGTNGWTLRTNSTTTPIFVGYSSGSYSVAGGYQIISKYFSNSLSIASEVGKIENGKIVITGFPGKYKDALTGTATFCGNTVTIKYPIVISSDDMLADNLILYAGAQVIKDIGSPNISQRRGYYWPYIFDKFGNQIPYTSLASIAFNWDSRFPAEIPIENRNYRNIINYYPITLPNKRGCYAYPSYVGFEASGKQNRGMVLNTMVVRDSQNDADKPYFNDKRYLNTVGVSVPSLVLQPDTPIKITYSFYDQYGEIYAPVINKSNFSLRVTDLAGNNVDDVAVIDRNYNLTVKKTGGYKLVLTAVDPEDTTKTKTATTAFNVVADATIRSSENQTGGRIPTRLHVATYSLNKQVGVVPAYAYLFDQFGASIGYAESVKITPLKDQDKWEFLPYNRGQYFTIGLKNKETMPVGRYDSIATISLDYNGYHFERPLNVVVFDQTVSETACMRFAQIERVCVGCNGGGDDGGYVPDDGTPKEETLPPEFGGPIDETATDELSANNQTLIASVISIGEKLAEKLKNFLSGQNAPKKLALGTVVGSIVGMVAAGLGNLLSVSSIGELFHSLIYALAAGITQRKKRNKMGKLVEAESMVALPNAKIELIRVENNSLTLPGEKNLVNTVYTDADGGFGFVAEPGRYVLEVVKEGYHMVYPAGGFYFPGMVIEVDEGENDLVAPTIALSCDDKSIKHKMIVSRYALLFEKMFMYLSLALLALGTMTIIRQLLTHRDRLTIFIAVVYLLLWILNLTLLRKTSCWGRVLDNSDEAPLPLALVRVTTKDGQRLVRTAVSNEKGKFAALVRKGNYRLAAVKSGYIQTNPVEIAMRDKLGTINRIIKLARKSV